MQFVWYWTFWYWSKEGYRSGNLLRSPLHGVGSHWDEWFRHEASADELELIEEAGRSESTQRQFIAWLYKSWSREQAWRDNPTVTQFVLNQLGQVPPFSEWVAFQKHRSRHYPEGISALVLAEGSSGEVTDVRKIGGLALPKDPARAGSKVLIEDFHAERQELDTPLAAVESLLCGKGLLIFLALWLAGGRRSYPLTLKILLSTGWLAVTFLIIYLLVGHDPAEHLTQVMATLACLWGALVLTAFGSFAWQGRRAWRAGNAWRAQLQQNQVRLKMAGGLTLKGSSAGLPFCLNMLHSVYRSWPRVANGSWIWRRIFCGLDREAGSWAATGVVTRGGFLKAVVRDQKIRACSRHAGIQHLLIPRQHGAGSAALRYAANESSSTKLPEAGPRSPKVQLGFAAEKPRLHIHACRHAAQALLLIGNFSARWQIALNALAIIASVILLAAAKDIRAILLPFPAPMVVAPSSPSPHDLWVSLDTKHPRYFEMELESSYWANRIGNVAYYTGANASVRAEIPLRRLSQDTTGNLSEGIVWVKRRQFFLTREFLPGEHAGRYTLPYLMSLGYK
jgi:hypothetical protein